MPETKSRRAWIVIVLLISLAAFVMSCPIMIFVLKYTWPKIRGHFDTRIQDLEGETEKLNRANRSPR